MIWYSYVFKNFQLVVILIVSRGRCFSEIPLLFLYPVDVGNLISGSSAFSKSSLNIWKFSVHVLLKPSFKDFEHDLASM